MNKSSRVLIAVAVGIAGIGAVIAGRGKDAPDEDVAPVPVNDTGAQTVAAADAAPLPRLLECGSTTCIPCKKMKVVLDQLEIDLEGQLEIGFIDVRRNTALGEVYNVKTIPTQIFFDADGNELYRHIGFYPRQDILAKWKELGYEFELPLGSDEVPEDAGLPEGTTAS